MIDKKKCRLCPNVYIPFSFGDFCPLHSEADLAPLRPQRASEVNVNLQRRIPTPTKREKLKSLDFDTKTKTKTKSQSGSHFNHDYADTKTSVDHLNSNRKNKKPFRFSSSSSFTFNSPSSQLPTQPASSQSPVVRERMCSHCKKTFVPQKKSYWFCSHKCKTDKDRLDGIDHNTKKHPLDRL